MNKRIGFSVLMLLSVACLCLVLFFLLGRKEAAPAQSDLMSPPDEKTEYIYFIGSTEDINSVSVRNNYGEYTMSGGTNPVILGYEDYPISDFYFLHFLDVASRLAKAGFVTDEESNLSIFGLEPAQAQIHIQSAKGGGITLYIGSVSPDNNVYVRLDNSNAVYLAYFFDVSIFLYNLNDLVDTAVTPASVKDQDDRPVFEKIILGGEAREEIVIVKNESAGSGNTAGFNMSPFRIISPLNAAVSMEHEAVFESFFGIYADRFTAKVSDNRNMRNEELSRYGLLRPWSTLELVFAQGSYRILFSKPDSRGSVYIFREGTSFIYEAQASDFAWLEMTHFELMDKMVLLPFIDNIASIDVKTRARTVTFTLSGTNDRLAVKAGNIDIDERNFRIFYQNLVAARYDEYNDVSVNALSPPFLEIVYHYRGRSMSSDTVSFYETMQRRALTSLNGGRAHFTFSTYTDQLLSDLDSVLAGERIRAFL